MFAYKLLKVSAIATCWLEFWFETTVEAQIWKTMKAVAQEQRVYVQSWMKKQSQFKLQMSSRLQVVRGASSEFGRYGKKHHESSHRHYYCSPGLGVEGMPVPVQ